MSKKPKLARPFDPRSPRERAAIRREAALLPIHPDNAAVDDWIEVSAI
jgi:hypothetical protein